MTARWSRNLIKRSPALPEYVKITIKPPRTDKPQGVLIKFSGLNSLESIDLFDVYDYVLRKPSTLYGLRPT